MDNKLVIISGPSGAGEDSIIKGLSKSLSIERVITTVTRDKRAGESEGDPYYFISEEDFQKKIEKNEFFEFAQHYNGNYYGVTLAEIERVKKSGRIGIWKIDYKGVIAAKKLMPELVAIFVTASPEVLEKRIRGRSGVTDDYVAERMDYSREWMKHTDIYDYTVVNEQGKLEQAIDHTRSIIEGLDK